MYAFLEANRGRTLIFVNSIHSIKRLLPLLQLLDVPAWGLYAKMQQRQRLKNLDRFRSTAHSVLLATDVAARGLDIPLIDHVVHFQVPRTIELYVHRAGRTARARASGVSLMMVGPTDTDNFLKLLRLPGKGDDAFKPMPIEPSAFAAVQRRVLAARALEVELHRNARRAWLKQENAKLTRQAHAAGLEGEIDVDEADIAVEAPAAAPADIDDDDGTDAMRLAAAKRALKHAKQDAARLQQQQQQQEEEAAEGKPMSKAARRRMRKRKARGIDNDDAADAKAEEHLQKRRIVEVCHLLSLLNMFFLKYATYLLC